MGRDQYHSSKRKLKYVPVGNETLVAGGEHSVTFEESAGKWSITRTFTISSHGEFLRCNLFIVAKTTQSLQRFGFPSGFCLSASRKHFSHTDESLMFSEEVIKPYVKKTKTAPETLYRSEGSSRHGRFD